MSRMRCSDRYVWMASMVLGVCLALAGCTAPGAAPELTISTPEVVIPATGIAPAEPVIAGRVLWGDAPVAGTHVELRTGAWADPQASQVVAQTVADAEGEYALEVPPNGADFGLVALWPDSRRESGARHAGARVAAHAGLSRYARS